MAADKNANGGSVGVEFEPVVDESHVEAELGRVSGLEIAGLQLDDDVSQLRDVNKKQVQREAVPANFEMHLPTDAREPARQLAKGIRDLID